MAPETEWQRQIRVGSQLPSLYYIPDYVCPAEEEALVREVRASRAKWVQLSGRRLQNHGGVVHAKGLIPAPLPSWLQPLLRRLATEGGGGSSEGGESKGGGLYGGQPPNHVLVNSYMPGEGIMPHEDGPAYHPVVAILSLGAPAVLRFRRKPRHDADAATAPASCGSAHTADAANGNGCSPAGPAAAASSSTSPANGSAAPTTNTTTTPAADPSSANPSSAQPTATDPASTDPTVTAPTTATASTAPNTCAIAASAASDASASAAPNASATSAPDTPQAPFAASVLLQPRSLVVFRDEAFTDCLHSIDEVYEERLDESVANLHLYDMEPGGTLPRGGERISLTVRRVARVMPAILRPR